MITLSQAISSDQINAQPVAPGTPSTGAPSPGVTPPASPGSGMNFLLPMLVVLAFFMIFTSMASRREKKKRQTLLNAIKKYDKVVTTGGIIGTVAEVRDDEIILRVDDSGNTKIRFQRSAIQTVLSESDPAKAPQGSIPAVEVKTKSPEKSVV